MYQRMYHIWEKEKWDEYSSLSYPLTFYLYLRKGSEFPRNAIALDFVYAFAKLFSNDQPWHRSSRCWQSDFLIQIDPHNGLRFFFLFPHPRFNPPPHALFSTAQLYLAAFARHCWEGGFKEFTCLKSGKLLSRSRSLLGFIYNASRSRKALFWLSQISRNK